MDRIIGGNLSPTVILTDSAAEAAAVAARLRGEMTRPPLAGLVANVRSLDDVVPPDQPAKIAEVVRLRKQLTPAVRATCRPSALAEIDRLLGTDALQPIARRGSSAVADGADCARATAARGASCWSFRA